MTDSDQSPMLHCDQPHPTIYQQPHAGIWGVVCAWNCVLAGLK